jgi:predicted ATPase
LKIRSINVQSPFPPFETPNFRFPEVEPSGVPLAEVHLLTGINGTGKSRLLYLIAAIMGNHEPLERKFSRLSAMKLKMRSMDEADGMKDLNIKFEDEATYLTNLNGNGQDLIPAYFNENAFAYSGVPYVTDTALKAMEVVKGPEITQKLSFQRSAAYSGFVGQSLFNLLMMASSHSRMKEQNHPLDPDSALASDVIQRIETVLASIVGQKFSFFAVPYPTPTLKVNLGPSQLAIEQLPDGIRSILGLLVDATVSLMAMTQGKQDPFAEEVIFLFDEIETHLHPAWQGKLLPAFQRLFPNAQIIAATHSPFLISSLNHGWIHRFYLENGIAKIAEPTPARLGDSYEDVMEDILGVTQRLDDESLSELANFRSLRDQALKGDAEAHDQARARVLELLNSGIGPELEDVLSRELRQMERMYREKYEAVTASA